MKKLIIFLFIFLTSYAYAQNLLDKENMINNDKNKKLMEQKEFIFSKISVGTGIMEPIHDNKIRYCLSIGLTHPIKNIFSGEIKFDYNDEYSLSYIPQIEINISKSKINLYLGGGMSIWVMEGGGFYAPVLESKLEYVFSKKFSTYPEFRYFIATTNSGKFYIINLNLSYKIND